MADYRFLWANAKTPADIQGEFTVENLAFSKIQNSPGIISAVLPLNPYPNATKESFLYPTSWYQPGRDNIPLPSYADGPNVDTMTRQTARALFGPDNFGAGRTVAYIERDGVILKGGILWAHNTSLPSNELLTFGEGWLSYFRRRTIAQTLQYEQVDQDTIARGIIDHVQSQGGGDIGIQTTANLHSKLRNRFYPWWEGLNAGEKLEQLADVIGGFDFDFVSGYNTAGVIETNFQTYYPANGRDVNIVLEAETNMDLLSYTVDAKNLANQARWFGSGFGAEVQTITRSDSASITSYPLLEHVESRPDISRVTTLAELADRSLRRRKEPTSLLTCRIHNDVDPKIGSYELGDRVLVTADYGYIQFDRTPFRITSHEVRVTPDEGEVSMVTLAQLPLFDGDDGTGGGGGL